jgi:phage-related protein
LRELGVIKPLYWVGSTKIDLLDFPEEVREEAGYALYLAQMGEKHSSVKPLKGFKGSGVLEIVEDHNTNTFRVVYTVTLKEAIYVLHAFQKKSKHGIATPKKEIDLIEARFKRAQEDYERRKK